ncbi:MAG: hypothetical protein EOP09_13990 [Proteobacteria bacterium]|nr:MAG: hypothetical protein EOP09_13990 [Pseudomonadota bacterium]
MKLNAQELRHGLNHGDLIKELDDQVKYEPFRKAVGIRTDKRMKGAELVLRYFAFRDDRANYQKPISSFLDQYSSKSRTMPKADADISGEDFRLVIDRVDRALGKLAFRIFDSDLKPTSPFNSALYDAEMIGFRETTNQKILTGQYKPIDLLKHTLSLFGVERFMNSIRQATSDEQAVKYRIDSFITHLNSF